MSLLPYKVTALARVDNGDLNIIPNASVTVLTSSGMYAQLYEADGTTPIGNPFNCDENGERQIYLSGGVYSISVAGGQSWEIRLSGASDIQSVATIADLRSYLGSGDSSQVLLGGIDSPGIGGGAFYRVTNAALTDDGRDTIRYGSTDIYWIRQDLSKYQIEDAAEHNSLIFNERDDTQLSTILRRNHKYQINFPEEFAAPFYTIPVNIFFKGGRYFTDFDARSLRPSRANTYYVAPNAAVSSDTNNGLSWDTAFATVGHALSLTGDNEIVVSPGKYYYPQGFVAVDKSTGFNLVCPDGIAEFSQEAYPRIWEADSAFPGTYTTPSVIQGEDWGAVSSQLRFFLVGSSGSSATTAGGTRIPAISRSAVQLGAVGVAVEADTTYIRLPGNRPPEGADFVVKYASGALNVNFNGASETHHVFLENISIGYGAPYSARFANDKDDCRVVCINCEFMGGHSGNTVEWDCLGWVINVGCTANSGFKDGFNYHISPGGSGFLNILEIDCGAHFNGKDFSGNNNGSTVHEALRAIRLNGDYSYNQNRNIHDIEASRSFNVGLKLRGGQSYDSPSFMVGRDAEPDSTRGWLVGCDVDIIRVANSATLYISDDTTYRDLQVESGGTVIDYNP